MKGMITSTQRLSIHDGPGIRTVIFMKGCHMRCKWCHNPETWSRKRQLQYLSDKCIGCGLCVTSCPEKALAKCGDKVKPDYALCTVCGLCAENCCSQALSVVGREISPEALLEEILIDKPYFDRSKGGITLSGGEPLLQKEFAMAFLALCRQRGLNTAVESNLCMDWEVVSHFLPYVDCWMCDLKLMDTGKHKYWTGVDNRSILANIENFGKAGIALTVRTPVVPGVNDSFEEIERICRFLEPYRGTVRYHLLPFHTLGFGKYDALGMENEMIHTQGFPKERLEELNKMVSTYKLAL